ncbi:hypothetical protein AB0C52_00455 [Streptomyces sp. NPDC048717]|uniref:hypothetical protein n=1 Tax=Streptomyces sp. NPDC048717 TaxID=3154928 RepID=UPI00341F380D
MSDVTDVGDARGATDAADPTDPAETADPTDPAETAGAGAGGGPTAWDDAEGPGSPSSPADGESNLKVIAKGVGEFLTETVGETLADLILQALACALLVALALVAYLSWSFSPNLTLAGAGALGAFLAYGALSVFRTPAKPRRYRWFAAAGATVFTAVASTAVFLLLYGTECGCL